MVEIHFHACLRLDAVCRVVDAVDVQLPFGEDPVRIANAVDFQLMGAESLTGVSHNGRVQLFQPSIVAFVIVQPFQREVVVVVSDAIVFNV